MKKFKLKKLRILAFLSAIMMAYTLSTSIHTAFAEDEPSMEKDYSDMIIPSGGISDELYDVMENSTTQDLIPVDIWITSCNIDEIENQVKTTIGYNKTDITAPYDRANLDTPIKNEYTADQVDLYIATERQMYSDCQLEQTNAFIQECLNIKNLQVAYNSDDIFISQYAPLIRVELTKDEIIQIAEKNNVEEICYSPDVEIEDETDVSIPLIHGDYTRDSLALTGSGVKIGQIEPGEPDRSQSFFTSSNIFYNTSKSRNYMDHANNVAAIMVANNYNGYQGIVPDAKLYSAYSSSTSDWYEQVEWLINQNVNVINMSAGTNSGGTYGTRDKWVDHIAINHSVHFVKSAGNNQGAITNPGMAYNAITVGGIDDNNTLNQSDDSIYSSSSYVEAAGYTNKPDLCAPAQNIDTADSFGHSGTSFAAPHVTAVVAQLCQEKPALKIMQSTVKSIITAGISHSTLSFESSSNQFDEMGAGCVDASEAFYVAHNIRYVHSTFGANSGNNITHTYTLNVNPNDGVVRVSLNWLKYSDISGTHSSSAPTLGTLADLDLKIYDKNDNFVKASASTYNNTEILKFTPNVSLAPYKIKVTQFSDSDRAVLYSVAWY